MSFQEYPKMIYQGDKGIIVNTKEEEVKLTAPATEPKKEDKKPAGWGK